MSLHTPRLRATPLVLVATMAAVALVACLLSVAPPIALAQEDPQPDADATPDDELLQSPDNPRLANPIEVQQISAALAGLTERSRMIESMTLQASRAYRRAAQERRDAMGRLTSASRETDQAAVRPKELTSERLDELVREELSARLAYEEAEVVLRSRLDDLRRLLDERDALSVRIADLRSRLPRQQELLTGEWEVTWLPAGVQGTFFLDQSGTLVSGQYELGQLGSGSLQGTFVSGKLFLQRIDSRRGRDAEIEGVLDADGRRMRGTWQSYELVQGGLPRGEWNARRVE